MIFYKTKEEIEIMRHSALLVGETLAVVAAIIKPGVTTMQLDTLAHEFIQDNGGVPSFLGYRGYPFATCTSVNDAVVHGFPNDTALQEGDVVSVDVGVFKNGFHGDSAYSFAIIPIAEEVQSLMRVTKESLYRAIEKAVPGQRIGDIAYAIQDYTEKQHRYGIVRDLVGHGLGRELHEDPQVPNFGKRGDGTKLKEGLVIAIEPMINLGKKEVYTDDDGWTIKTKDGKPSVHYEHNVCIRKGKADVLSSFATIEAAEKANPYLFSDY
ncbi:MAG: type I methionyl aminopeptidase [Ferruginibacter sp.]